MQTPIEIDEEKREVLIWGFQDEDPVIPGQIVKHYLNFYWPDKGYVITTYSLYSCDGLRGHIFKFK